MDSKSIYYAPGYELGTGKRVVQRLHTASLRAVYEVQDEDGKMLAVKVFHHTRDLAMTPLDRGRRRLVHEYEVLSRLRGLPCFPQVLDQAMHNGDALMLMDLLRGRTFPRFLAEGPTLGEALHAFLGACKAVAVLHDQGVRHRDIKPGNIFVLENGEAVLLDLGACQTHVSDPITGPDEIVGTPQYVSPEYASYLLTYRRGTRRAAPEEDIYALGVCLYELIAGMSPLEVPAWGSLQELLEEIAEVEPLHPSTVLPEAKPLAPLGDLAMQWMNKDPRQRPAMGIDAVKALEETMAKMGDVMDKPLPGWLKPRKVISIGLGRHTLPEILEYPEPRSVRNTPATPMRARQRTWRLRGGNLVTLLALVVTLVMGLAVLVLLLRLPSWERPPRDEASQAGGRNDLGKDQVPSKPPTPAPDQKRPPCEPKYEVEMGAACWQPSKSKTCTDDGFWMNGRCYVPVRPDGSPPVGNP